MPFSALTVELAWNRANGHCESCGKTLSWNKRGIEGACGAWEAHHKTSVAAGGSDALSNCKILCLNCHKATRTYGG